MRRSGTWIQRWRVPLGFLCAALFILFARPQPVTLLIGAGISIVGLLLRAWASGHIRKNSALATSGPYAYTRNPLYLGSFILGLGFTVGAGRWLLAALFGVLFLGIYLPVMRVESATMGQYFAQDFRDYARAVPMFLPRLTAYGKQSQTKFDPGLYLRYREYQAALGLLIAWGLLILKMYFWK
ncbi:MAG: isoprenylcysteine carboxylmethyltransferase family protein [Blastocatellia bacterium]|nr:isoprenylcysteine carboxylmethyltransferase family protein [Blastocatellia bacterium]